jgi:hypothetical protein
MIRTRLFWIKDVVLPLRRDLPAYAAQQAIIVAWGVASGAIMVFAIRSRPELSPLGSTGVLALTMGLAAISAGSFSSVFVKAELKADEKRLAEIPTNVLSFFKCPGCGESPLLNKTNYLECYNCKKKWEFKDGIYDFREPLK